MTILQRVASGDQSAVNECIDRYGGLVWSLARKLCPTRADAEDAVQDVFISVWQSADRYDALLGSESTFIAMIARRRLIDRIRRRQRRPDNTSLSPEITEAILPDPTPDSNAALAFELDESASRALNVLNQLSREQQRVLRLSIIHGLSHEKIAESLDMPLGTVKTHIRRGLIKARSIIAADAQPQPGDPTPANIQPMGIAP